MISALKNGQVEGYVYVVNNENSNEVIKIKVSELYDKLTTFNPEQRKVITEQINEFYGTEVVNEYKLNQHKLKLENSANKVQLVENVCYSKKENAQIAKDLQKGYMKLLAQAN